MQEYHLANGYDNLIKGPNKSFSIKSRVDEGTSFGFIIDISNNEIID